jgi:hypothetical protein
MKVILLNFFKSDKIEKESKISTEGNERKEVIFGFSTERIRLEEREPKINLRKNV